MSCYTFSKGPALIETPTGIPGPGPYYTCLVTMDSIEAFPFDYALYFSPDHDPNDGGKRDKDIPDEPKSDDEEE